MELYTRDNPMRLARCDAWGPHALESRRPTVAPVSRTLSELLAALPSSEVQGDASTRVAGLAYRASDVTPGDLFFCVPGGTHDGHDFAAEAVERGAEVLVVERWLEVRGRTQVRVPLARRVMGPIAAAFWGNPADRLSIIGITGTNGKTTTTYLLESIFQEAGLLPGVVGTTGVRVGGRAIPQARTTPEAPDLHRLLFEMAESGVGAVAMEVSSHGLDQHRVDGVRFDCAVFTNLSQDHLDYHGTLEDYFLAKARLFTPEMAARAVVNADAAEHERLAAGGVPTLTFGLDEGADFRATDVELGADGIRFRVDGLEIRSRLRGGFNVHNCLGALASARQVGIEDDAAVRGIAAVREVPGRLEPVDEGQEFLVVVDYAHTPDSLDNVLRTARPLATAGGVAGRVIAVFGCGGDRDRGKRPLMGEVATRLADLAIVTSDNPRSEDPMAIIREIEPGAKRSGGDYVVEPDRRRAIRLAVDAAEPGDVVVIAGKGHETGQEFADRTIPFDDRRVASEELRAGEEESS